MVNVDIAIVGAGLVGSAAAIACAGLGYSVALIDQGNPFVTADLTNRHAHDDWDSRIYAITPANKSWLEQLGVWKYMPQERMSSVEKMRIWGDDAKSSLSFDAYEANQQELAFIIENRTLMEALQTVLAKTDIQVCLSTRCLDYQVGSHVTTIELDDHRTINAKLVIAADGGNSWVRKQAGIPVSVNTYAQSAIVANFQITRPHFKTAMQWFLSDSILAWLPLPENRISIVWSTCQSERLMQLSPEALTVEVANAGQHVLGDMTMISQPQCFKLVKQTADRIIGPRLALMGDAAHRVHPLAGQGVNLGFRDVITFIEALACKHIHADIADIRFLRAYERARAQDTISLGAVTHGLYWLYAQENGFIKQLRNQGLSLVNHQKWLKQALIQHAII